MENLQRRPNGVYVSRLTVPARLRHIVGKREFVSTTGTHNLAVAKLVCSAQLAQWRQQLFDLDRMTLGGAKLDHDSVVRIADGHPILAGGGYLPLLQASAASGLDVADILRHASDGLLGLFCRLASVPGYLLAFSALKRDDGELGTMLVPSPADMPEEAQAHVASGVHAVPTSDAPAIAAELLVSGEVEVVIFQVIRDVERPIAFVPDLPVGLTAERVEVFADAVNAIRAGRAASIQPLVLEAARTARTLSGGSLPHAAGKHAGRLLSEALDAYARNVLPHSITSKKEIERIKTGIRLLIEFEGDLVLTAVDGELLRHFRDKHLSRMPAQENLARIKHGTGSMSESIVAVAGTAWPVMSPDERDLRMQWIARMFRWLHEQKWIADDPATALRRESVLTKAERARAVTERKDREEFTPHELGQIFGASWFKTGAGARTTAGTFRQFQPFRYWLPLLGVFTGARIGELCQLRLADVECTEGGAWFIDINRTTTDKSLKNAWSARRVPIHPAVVALGLPEWCERLRSEGFSRLFPELSWNATNRYAKEPIRTMSQFLEGCGMPRDGTKVFHSFRHGMNNRLQKATSMPDIMRKRLMGHEPGDGVNERHYLSDSTPDEMLVHVKTLNFGLPNISVFDIDQGIEAVRDALGRKGSGRRDVEDLGGT
jgi:integrase